GQNLFPFVWLLAGWFRLLGYSLSSLWAFPALASALSIPMAYAACRNFLSRTQSFFYTVLLAFGFWGLFAGRIAMFTAWVPFQEAAALYLFGLFIKADSNRRIPLALALGLGLGTGFYLYPLAWLP